MSKFKSGDKVRTVKVFNNNRGELVRKRTKAKVFQENQDGTYTILFDDRSTGVVTDEKIAKRIF